MTSRPHRARRLRGGAVGWLPPARSSRYFVAAFFVDSVGTGLFLAGAALFFTRAVGLSTAQVGAGLTAAGVCGLICSVPLGRAADRFGCRRTIVALYIWRGAGFLAYLLVRDFAGFVVVACLLGAGEWTFAPIVQTMVAATETPQSRVRTMAAVNAVRNVGFALGALLATLAIAARSADAYRMLVLADAASFFVAAAALSRVVVPVTPAERRTGRRRWLRDIPGRHLLLASCNGVLFLHTVVLTVALPLWIVSRTHAPTALVGVVVIVNTVLAAALGVSLSRRAEGAGAGAARQHWAGWCLAAACLLVAVTEGLSGPLACAALVAAAVALTLGEVWQSVGSLGLSYALAPERDRGYHLSVYRLGEPCAAIAGPALLTGAVLGAGSVGWVCLGCVFAAAGVAVRGMAARAPAPDAARAGTHHMTPKGEELPCAS